MRPVDAVAVALAVATPLLLSAALLALARIWLSPTLAVAASFPAALAWALIGSADLARRLARANARARITLGAISDAVLQFDQRLSVCYMGLQVSDAALAEIGKAGFDPVFGARPLKRAIQEHIENPLSKKILDGSFGPKDVVVVDADASGHISFRKPN